MRENMSRRDTLKLLVAAPALSVAITACGKKDKPDSCNDVSSLNDGEKAARQALQYTDTSPHPDKHCSDCSLFQPAPDPAQCSACQVIRGPIHPDGYCSSYAKKVTPT